MGSGFRPAVWWKTSALEALQGRLRLRYAGGPGRGLREGSDRWCPGQASTGLRRRQAGIPKRRRRDQEKVPCSWRFLIPLVAV